MPVTSDIILDWIAKDGYSLSEARRAACVLTRSITSRGYANGSTVHNLQLATRL